jgi:hypothetical protein
MSFFIFLPRNLVYITHVFSFILFSLSTIPPQNSRVLSRTTHHQQRRFPALDQLNRSRHGGGILLLEQLTLSYVRPEPHRLSVGRPLRPRPTGLHRYVIFFSYDDDCIIIETPFKNVWLEPLSVPKKIIFFMLLLNTNNLTCVTVTGRRNFMTLVRATEPHLV